MGLFSKKTCDICGEKIGLFGNRKVEDGNVCSDCADKLSPWFDDRRHSTLEEIRAQLASREENRKVVEDFSWDVDLGDNYHVLFDEGAGTFVVVTDASRYMLKTVNPDVFHLRQVKDARLEINDSRRELYREDSEGNKKSYNPRRYLYRYSFYVEITLDHPYVDEIRFKLNSGTLEIEWEDRGFSLFGDNPSPTRDYDYRRYENMGREIVDKLLAGGPEKQEQPEKEEAVEVPEREEAEDDSMTVCPYCGSRVKKARFCTNCGAGLEG